MNKIIIDNKTELSDITALTLACEVINQGRISNNNTQYCYVTRVEFKGKYYMIYSDLNKKSDRLVIATSNN